MFAFRASLVLLALLFIAGCCSSSSMQTPTAGSAVLASDDAEFLAEQRTWEQLQQPVTLAFDDTPLAEALAAWHEQVGVNMVVDWKGMANAGIAEDMPIRLNIVDVPAHVGLGELLRKGSSDFDYFVFEVHGPIVYIAPESELIQRTVTRTYNVRPLLVPPQPFEDGPEITIDETDAGRSGGLFFADPDYDPSPEEERLYELEELIRLHCGRIEDWDEFGGADNGLRSYQGHFIIRGAPSVHRDVRELLDMLIAARPTRTAVDAWMLSMPTSMVDRLRIANADTPGVLDARQVDRLLSAIHDGRRDITLLATARTAMFDGQRCHLSTTRQSARPAEGDDASAIINEGETLDIETLRLPPGQGIQLTVRAALSMTNGAGDQTTTLTRWHAATRVPDGGGVLLAGSLAEGTDTPAADHRETVLLLRVRTEPAEAD